MFQNTLKKAATLDGVGVHGGMPAQVILRPAPAGTGVLFIRTDLEGWPQIKADYRNVLDTRMATVIGKNGAIVSTVEHLMCALMIMGIDNVVVEVNNAEVPILDGSAAPFCDAIRAAGVQSQFKMRPAVALKKRIEVKVGEKWAVAEPSKFLEVHGSIEFDHPVIGYQEFHYRQGDTPYDEIAGARTFGFLSEYEVLKAKGLARGASLDNVVVLNEAEIVNPDGLRYYNEFIRHKVLDALGDFKLAGMGIVGKFRLHRAGHDLHHKLLTAIFQDQDNYTVLGGSPEDLQFPQEILVALSRQAV